MSNLRVVVDTGVVVSAVLQHQSVPRQAFDAVLTHGKLLTSDASVIELDDVLRRPKFNKYISEALRLEFLAAFVQVAEYVEITEVVTDCRDAKDNKFLELAVSGKASHIIASDNDLLSLNPYRAIAILSPLDFLRHVQS